MKGCAHFANRDAECEDKLKCSVNHYLLDMAMKTISATEANRRFSSLLREVASGATVTVLSRGRAVATLAPAGAQGRNPSAARERLLQRLRQQEPSGARTWSRDELYAPEAGG